MDVLELVVDACRRFYGECSRESLKLRGSSIAEIESATASAKHTVAEWSEPSLDPGRKIVLLATIAPGRPSLSRDEIEALSSYVAKILQTLVQPDIEHIANYVANTALSLTRPSTEDIDGVVSVLNPLRLSLAKALLGDLAERAVSDEEHGYVAASIARWALKRIPRYAIIDGGRVPSVDGRRWLRVLAYPFPPAIALEFPVLGMAVERVGDTAELRFFPVLEMVTLGVPVKDLAALSLDTHASSGLLPRVSLDVLARVIERAAGRAKELRKIVARVACEELLRAEKLASVLEPA